MSRKSSKVEQEIIKSKSGCKMKQKLENHFWSSNIHLRRILG
jgi:hypothetical protein